MDSTSVSESFKWADLVFGKSLTLIIIQSCFLLIAAASRIRWLIEKRIGGMAAIEIRSWPRLIIGTLLCNGAFLSMHHLYLHYGPSNRPSFAFIGLHFLSWVIVSISVVPFLGLVIDGGKAVRVRTDRYKPEHSPYLVDMTKEGGKIAQLIPRGAIFAYQFLMVFTWIVISK